MLRILFVKQKTAYEMLRSFVGKQKTAYEMLRSLVGSEMCIRDRNDGYGPKVEDEQDLTLADALADGHRLLLYTYDFGDDWCHDVVVDAVEDAVEGVFYPRCVAGARACSPEDVGGAPGYAVFLDAMADPRHAEHAEQILWLEEVYGVGELDPEAFDAEAVSRLRRPPRARVSAPHAPHG